MVCVNLFIGFSEAKTWPDIILNIKYGFVELTPPYLAFAELIPLKLSPLSASCLILLLEFQMCEKCEITSNV